MSNNNENEQMMSWDTILSESRTKKINSMNPDFASVWKAASFNNYPFEFDCFTVSSCSAIRAMQDKTQVFAFGSSNFCRTRLTHSLEVASTASSIISMIDRNDPLFFKDDEKTNESGFKISLKEKIKDVVYAAGLLHDIGNPPFGHMGEQYLSQAIISWLEKEKMLRKVSFDNSNNIITNNNGEHIIYIKNDFMDKDHMQDLINIEGNAQGIRYLIAETPIKELGTIKPTYAVLSSLMKYTSNQPDVTSKFLNKSNSTKNNPSKKIPVHLHKKGFYLSEAQEIQKIFDDLQIKKVGDNYVRNPLAFILEAADDISYRTADFEDALLKGIITVKNIETVLKNHLKIGDEKWENLKREIKKENISFDTILQKLNDKSQESKNLEYGTKYDASLLLHLILKIEDCNESNDFNKFHEYLHEWVTQLKTQLIYVAAWSFQENINGIMNGTFSSELLNADRCYHQDIMVILEELMKKYVYNSDEVSFQNRQAEFFINKVWSNLTEFIKNKRSEDFNNDSFKMLPMRLQKTLIELDAEKADFLYTELRIIIDFICSLSDEEIRKLANWEVLNNMIG
jgi:deoxyguanosinetriphosphate triphosphohydrolase-like protein